MVGRRFTPMHADKDRQLLNQLPRSHETRQLVDSILSSSRIIAPEPMFTANSRLRIVWVRRKSRQARDECALLEADRLENWLCWRAFIW